MIVRKKASRFYSMCSGKLLLQSFKFFKAQCRAYIQEIALNVQAYSNV